VSERTGGPLGRLVADPPSPWLAVPVGFSLAVLVAALFGEERTLAPFAAYVLAVTVMGVVGLRSVVAGTNIELSLLALVCGAAPVGFMLGAVQEVRRDGRPSSTLLIMLFVAAMLPTVLCWYLVRLIVLLRRRMKVASTPADEESVQKLPDSAP
jgi:hypothetical protein